MSRPQSELSALGAYQISDPVSGRSSSPDNFVSATHPSQRDELNLVC